ncbi:MAG: GFA family protein [Methylotenera sp.]
MSIIYKTQEGGCLCGAVRFRSLKKPVRSIICHCHTCRKATGATRVAWAVVQAENFILTNEMPASYESSLGVLRTFCKKCGTSLTYQQLEAPHMIDVTIASFDQPAVFAPEEEIWVTHKVAWEIQNITLPQLPEDYI